MPSLDQVKIAGQHGTSKHCIVYCSNAQHGRYHFLMPALIVWSAAINLKTSFGFVFILSVFCVSRAEQGRFDPPLALSTVVFVC